MKKLKILKAIVDFIWIISIPIILILVIAIPGVFFINDYEFINDITIEYLDTETVNPDSIFVAKCLIVPQLIADVLIYVSFFYFRKLLEEFYRTKLFSLKNSYYLNKSGVFLSLAGVIIAVFNLISNYVLFTKFKLDLIFSIPIVCIITGLFFMVLSEVFKISVKIKNENDLTI